MVRASSSRCYYDVLLSFRGEDTRKAFTDHLFAALMREGIRTFRDEEEIPRAENINLAIQKAINGSKIAIVVFSENFASSKWCLHELGLIMKRRRTAGLVVLPVFYKVDPSEVGEQTGRYGEAFAEHESQTSLKDKNKTFSLKDKIKMCRVKRWRADLKLAAELGGMVLGESHESQFIQSIVEEIKGRLTQEWPDVSPCLSWMGFLSARLFTH